MFFRISSCGVIRADKVKLNEGQFKNFTDLNNKPFDLLNIEPCVQ